MVPLNKYLLRLYLAGIPTESQENILYFKQMLKDRLGDDYTLEIIDILMNPELAEGEKIVATPTLLKKIPAPVHKIILDFHSKQKLLLGMDLILTEE